MLTELTTCSQSQIGQDCDLRLERTVQVEEASALSVGVRWGWHASGTAAEDDPGIRLRRWFHP